MEFYVQLVTPEMARVFLQNSVPQRKVTQDDVDFLAKEMATGNWHNTGHAILVSDTGKMIDGQHRMLAVVKSGKTVEMSFAKGADESAFHCIDVGRRRTASDVLSIKGVGSANNVHAAVRFILQIQQGKLNKVGRIPTRDVLAFLDQHKDLTDTVNWSMKEFKRFRMVSSSLVAALYHCFSDKHVNKCDDFFEKYFSGSDMKATHPVMHLRNKLMNNVTNKTKYSTSQKIIMIITAWNHFVKGTELTKFVWDDTKMPKIL